uniref:Uncharacterized protein n=1 Tax=Daphnia galeata TaxID=27404 RepID=A0A8J2RJR7_9CRUS|nr:unnamed protein product [Daphnia galeata]
MEGQFLKPRRRPKCGNCEDNLPTYSVQSGSGCESENEFRMQKYPPRSSFPMYSPSSILLANHSEVPEQSALPDNYIFEWGSGMTSGQYFECGGHSSQSVLEYDSGYRLTPSNLEWKDARSHCLQLGGDLAHFTNEKSFASILRKLDNLIPPNITHFESYSHLLKGWSTWIDEQRTPQHFLQYTNGFQCSVYDFLPNEGINPLAECITGTRSKKVRGLCVLPPKLSSDNFDYVQLSCPAKCGVSGYSDYCWADAEADTKVSQSCPTGLIGTATWKCGVNGQWITSSPDLSNCTNPVVDNSINEANNENKKKSENGNGEDQENDNVASGNIVRLDQTIKLAIEKQTSLINATDDPSLKDQSSKNFTISVIDLSDVVMANSNAFWGLDWTARSEAIDQVQNTVDDTLYLLAENLLDTVENKMNADYNNDNYTYDAEDENQLTLPAGFPYLVNDTTTNTQLSFATKSRKSNLIIRTNKTSSGVKSSGCHTRPTKRIYQFDDGEFVEILLSTLNLDLYEVNETSATCVFWDSSTEDWSSDGCEKVVTNDTEEDTLRTRCRCNHLTNFAVLMDINGIFQNKAISALDYITVIGESISIVCLTLTLITLNWILLLAGIDATTHEDLCLSIAVFMHLFFLCAFSWMFIEGLYMYFVITKVFEGKVLKRWQYYFIGYGVPVLVVAITLGATKTEAYINPSLILCSSHSLLRLLVNQGRTLRQEEICFN